MNLMNVMFGKTYAYNVQADVVKRSGMGISITSNRELTEAELKEVILKDSIEGASLDDIYDEYNGDIVEIKGVDVTSIDEYDD